MEYQLSKLLEKAALVLAKRTLKSEDGRVQSVPDVRTLRYYQSLGLVSKPIRYQGRTAIYPEESLHQIVLVKLLQQQGYSLQQIQKRMLVMTPQDISDLFQKVLPEADLLEQPIAFSPKTLHSVELAPGVIVTIDPDIVDEPNKIIQFLFTHIQGVLS